MFNWEFLNDYEGKEHTLPKINNQEDLEDFMIELLSCYSKLGKSNLSTPLQYVDKETGLNSNGINVFENGLYFEINNSTSEQLSFGEEQIKYAVFALPTGIIGFPIAVNKNLNSDSSKINLTKLTNMLSRLGKEIKCGSIVDYIQSETNPTIKFISLEEFYPQQLNKINYILKLILENKKIQSDNDFSETKTK